jgi:hypothetical protein
MGEAAPVGSLVLTSPVQSLGDVRSGDIIAYDDGETGRVVTHRVVAVGSGSVTTRGDLNGAVDPRPVAPEQILGKATAVVVGAGWFLRAAPILACASIGLALVAARVKDWLRRRAVWVVGESLAVAVVVLVLRPLVGVQEVSRRPGSSGVTMTFVSTGLLPVRISADSGAHADLAAGQLGSVESTTARSDGRFWFVPALHLDWGGWSLMLLAASIPTLLLLWWGRAYAARAADAGPRSNSRALLAALVAVLVAVGTGIGLGSGASFAAQMTTTANTTGARTFFTCRAAESGTAVVFVAYAMGTSGFSEPDLSGHGFTGSYSITPTTSASRGCLRDQPVASARFDGLTTCLNTPDAAVQTSPNVFTLEAWFATASAANGKIIGFSNAHGVLGLFYDRHIYLDPAGRLVFGVNAGGPKIAASPPGTSFADGAWHHAVATLSPDGMRLYADGVLVASNPGVTMGQSYSGYWQMGCGALGGWVTGSGGAYLLPPSFFNGLIQYAAVYSPAFTPAQVAEHFLAGAP